MNEHYVEMVKIYSCKDINDCVSDSVVSKELTSLSLICFICSSAAAVVIFNFFFGPVCEVLGSGLLHFGVDVFPGVGVCEVLG